jgi:hypothetical protein
MEFIKYYKLENTDPYDLVTSESYNTDRKAVILYECRISLMEVRMAESDIRK